MLDRILKIADRAASNLSRRSFFRRAGESALPVVGFLGAWLAIGQSAQGATTVWACKYVCAANSKTKWFCSQGYCPANPQQGGCRYPWILIQSSPASCTCKEGAKLQKCCNDCIKAVKKGRGEPDQDSADPTVI